MGRVGKAKTPEKLIRVLSDADKEGSGLVQRKAFANLRDQAIASFVLWRRAGDEQWNAGDDIDFSPADDDEVNPDGSWLLDVLLDDIAGKYIEYAENVHEVDLIPSAVEHIVSFSPLTQEVIRTSMPKPTRFTSAGID
ncbi:hypothetical protein Cci01nite_19480 [Catellatospora citrea]|uniref:Uncharacterized protein n=2 Tax=Catellatospora citrea TaxID=53366 RepID=A0A8J3K9Y9_9ACTN|nr:hypothetical protein C8E86_0308 [Catellatospora citrea]GIF96854.1 hypothetical protein Cci01nite_19480 [Catellatospora citrea]